MNLGFLFWFFLVGIVVASLQDLKRREVDNWLNLFLGIGGSVFILYKAFFEKDLFLALSLAVGFGIMFVIENAFYYGRVFAGGDAKLLLAITPLFVTSSVFLMLKSIGIFLGLLMLSGSVYGIFYSLVLYFKDRKKINLEMKKVSSKKFLRFVFLIGILFSLFGILFKFFNYEFWILVFILGIIVLLFPLLYVFSKALEEVSMIREVSGKFLREGDWIVNDVRVNGKLIKSSWDGLTKEDLKLLKDNKKIKIKDGLPFVPAFLISFLLYFAFREFIINFLNLF